MRIAILHKPASIHARGIVQGKRLIFPPKMNPITILLADDNPRVRESLRELLSMEKDLSVIGEATNGSEAVTMAGGLHPDIVLMDISMPLMNGLEATRLILQDRATTKVLILSSHDDDAYVQRSIALGASGYIVKQSDPRELPHAIRHACQGKPFLGPANHKHT